MTIDPANAEAWLARMEQMIAEYRAGQRRRLLQQVTKFRRLAETFKTRVGLEEPPRRH